MASDFVLVFVLLQSLMYLVEGREFCKEDAYWCDVGHCCGNGECCTYYYELWWFWLVWFMIVFIIGFCVWQRKRCHPWQDHHHYRNRSGLCIPPELYPDIMPIPPVKLPTYAEIGETVSFDTPPPPYTCDCYMQGGPPTVTTSGIGSFDHPPSDIGAPPVYMRYSHIIAPLLPRLHPNASMGTQFPEGTTSPAVVTISPESSTSELSSSVSVEISSDELSTPLVPQEPQEPQQPLQPSLDVREEAQCLSCSSLNGPPMLGRSCSCASVQNQGGSVTVQTRPGHAVSVNLVPQRYVAPSWLSNASFGKVDNVSGNLIMGNRLQVPSRGLNNNPCPMCVSRSLRSLRHCVSSSAITRDASTSTLPCVALDTSQPRSNRNEEPDRFVRRNSNSLPRNFACNTIKNDKTSNCSSDAVRGNAS